MDIHCEKLLKDFKDKIPLLVKQREIILSLINKLLLQNNLVVTVVEARVKTINSFKGKLELKGHKYKNLSDITDLVGARIVTYYSNQVDKVAAIFEKYLIIDRENTVDKRKIQTLNTFGYMSLHYICKIPKELYFNPDFPEINEIKFELQMRSALQHVWATIYHDIGYKYDVEVPKDYLRRLNRLAGLMEIADEEFDNVRIDLENYRRRVKNLIADGNYDDIMLDGEGFNNYMQSKPFDELLERFAAINTAEITEVSSRPYLDILIKLGFKTLGDLERLKADCSEDAYKFTVNQIGGTDIDIIASNLAIKNLVIVYIIKNSENIQKSLIEFLDVLYGEREKNISTAKRIIKCASNAGIIKSNQ